MNDIEKRARELLAAEFDKCGNHGAADDVRHAVPMSGARIQLMAVRAIIAALTPPVGYVLVPVEPTDAIKTAGIMWNTEMDECPTYEALSNIWRDMLAARPEVK